MKASDIISHLQDQLPKTVDYFNDTIEYLSISNVGYTVTVVSANPHDLETGKRVVLAESGQKFVISSLTQVDGVATAVTPTQHDYTYEPAFRPTIPIQGAADELYNGDMTILGVPDRYTIKFRVDSAAVATDTGSPYFIDNHRSAFNGPATVTVLNTTSFSFTVPTQCNAPPDGSLIGTPIILTSPRISGAANISRLVDSYTAQDPEALYAFVVMEDFVIGRDRAIQSDGTQTLTKQQPMRAIENQQFSVYVFMTTSQSLSGYAAKDFCNNEVKLALYRSLIGWAPPEIMGVGERQIYQVTPVESGTYLYDGAKYIHRYLFERPVSVTRAHGIQSEDDRAFRDVTFSTLNEFNETLQTTTVNLDENI